MKAGGIESVLNDSEELNVQEADARIEVLRDVPALPGGIVNLVLQLTGTTKCANASL